jgi:serine acetyltransferase
VGQNVTIGSRNVKRCTTEDNVSIWVHTVVLGDIAIGHDSQIGAGAIAVKSVLQIV